MQWLNLSAVDVPFAIFSRRQLKDPDVRHDQSVASTSKRNADELEICD